MKLSRTHKNTKNTDFFLFFLDDFLFYFFDSKLKQNESKDRQT